MIHFDSEADMELEICNHVRDFEVFPWVQSPHRVVKIDRQVRVGEYGIVDIVALVEDMKSGGKWIEVVELKNAKLKSEHLAQLARYKSFFMQADHDVRFTLIGLKTFPNSNDDCFLIQESKWASVYEITISFEGGVSFDLVGNWRVSAPGQKCDEFISLFTNTDSKE